jgi:hypothetical protein
MRPFLVRFASFSLIQLVILLAVVGLYRPTDRHFLAAAIDKHRRLEQLAPPRLVLVGGSNLAFGMNCDTLEAEFHRPVVNMALHASTGGEFQLNEVRNALRPGDIVVVGLVYENFYIDFSPSILLRLLDSRPASWKEVPAAYYPALLDYGLTYTGGVAQGAVNRLRHRADPIVSPYARDGFTPAGDDTLRPPFTTELNLTTVILRGGRIEREFGKMTRALNQFDAECRRKGVRAYFFYPSLPETRYRAHADQVKTFRAELDRTLKMPVINTPESVVYPDSFFYDTEYHLTPYGVAVNAHRLVESLRAALVAEASGKRPVPVQ